MFRAWITSCVSCLWPQADQESKGSQARQHIGVEREMEICHSQPHLVPPMKLVFYGDLPSPGGHNQSRSTPSLLPPWVQETRNLASRASQSASVLLTRKKTQSRPIIGAPTDFRRVEPLPRRRASFRPLELSIYLPGNRLSDLPEFGRFDLDTPGQPSPPAKALMSPFDSSGHIRRDSGPFQFSRKPVGSAPSRRGSFATVDLQLQQAKTQMQARQSMDGILASPLIPHFSMINTLDRHPLSLPPQISHSHTDCDVILTDRPLSSKSDVAPMTRRSLDHRRASSYITGKRQPGQTQPLPPLPRPSSRNNNTTTANHHSAKSSSTFQSHSRMRTTSNSTASSRTPSLSSAITAATTIYPSEKELEAPFTTALPMIPASVKNSVVVEEPLVLEDQDSLSPRRGGYEFDQRFPLSPVGVAF
ncbi:conserved hypothetical protein [Talaromyces stipitatus ATCC 10500]|uniref:Uncharacterized protein n=1 Tax=Talaromyces stipitatus (strain ATCC 10500 / CBS 375.48 / QM 6759 / NRRL 1006) TaxID=441959 RepID=B8MRP9_TALSN|nr:uncharacterized protein TSTA_057020 [Talaromyces stipitatus ATCC 10500]EED13206.1 conserved hypothetical protein [Talaromyces stipitatus ATCC 10500]